MLALIAIQCFCGHSFNYIRTLLRYIEYSIKGDAIFLWNPGHYVLLNW